MLRIGRLAKIVGLEPKTLRYYDRIGLLRPASRTPAGYRLYTEDAVAQVQFVKRAKLLGLSLGDIAKMLAFRQHETQGSRELLRLVTGKLEELQTKTTQLEELRNELPLLQHALKRGLRARRTRDTKGPRSVHSID